MSLSTLPTEIILEIGACLSWFDLKALRRTNRNFTAITLCLFPRETYVGPTRESLARLHAISSHPFLSRHINTLEISYFMYLPYKSQEEWEHDFGDHDGCKLKAQPSSGSQYRSKEEFAFCLSQRSMLRSGYVTTVKATISKLPNLKWIKILEKRTKALLPGETTRYDNPYHWLQYCNQVAPGARSTLAPRLLNNVHLAMSGLTQAHAQRQLCLEFQGLPHGLQRNDYTPWQCALEKLTELDFRHDSLHFDEADIWDRVTLDRFLNLASNLVKLTLWLWPHVRTTSVFNNNSSWPRLRSLKLGSLTIERDHMLDFFSRHGSGLDELCFLERVNPADKSLPVSWIEFLEYCSHVSLSNLRNFVFFWFTGQTSEKTFGR